MSDPLSENASPSPVEDAATSIGARLEHYHRLASLHHALITLFDEPDEHRFVRSEMLQATAESIAETARTSGLAPATQVDVREALHFYPIAHRHRWLARDPGDLLGEWETLSAETEHTTTPAQADAPDVAGSAALERAGVLQQRLLTLYDIENAPGVVHTEDGPEYVLLDTGPNPKLAESIAGVEKEFEDHLRAHRIELENVPDYAAYYVDYAERDYLRLRDTPPDLHEHTVSIGYFDTVSPFSIGFPPGPQVQAPNLASAYRIAVDTITHIAAPDQQIRLRISREIAGQGRTVIPDTAHYFTDTAGHVVSNLITLHEHHTGPERGAVREVIGNRIRLRHRDPQAHPDREVVVGWDRGTDSFFAQVIDGTDPHGEDVLTLNAGADTIREITEPHRVIDMVRPYAAIPTDLLDRLTSQYHGKPRETAQSEPAHTGEHRADRGAGTSEPGRGGERIGRLLGSAASSEPRPPASAPSREGPAPAASTGGVLGAPEPRHGQGYELG